MIYINNNIQINANQVTINLYHNKDSAENVENVENVENTESVEDVEGSESAEDVEIIKEIENILHEKWEVKKKDNVKLADAYKDTSMDNGEAKAGRLLQCARWLEFCISEENQKQKLVKASSCHVRLCPICQWRRSTASFHRLAVIYSSGIMLQHKQLFLTLTQKNVTLQNLHEELKKISKAFLDLMRRKEVKEVVRGYTRSIEVTYNQHEKSWHPHIHAILTVQKSYGKKDYITQDKWALLWAQALHIDYKPIVHIKAIKNFDGKTIAEIAKYSVKPSDYVSYKDLSDWLEMLDKAVDNKRLLALGGITKELQRLLFAKQKIDSVDSVEDGTDNLDSIENWEDAKKIIYAWHFEEKRYKKMQ